MGKFRGFEKLHQLVHKPSKRQGLLRVYLMLNITTRQELLSRIVDTLGIVVEDARFDFDENGLSVRVVDPSHVAMVKLDVDLNVFDSWEVEETKMGLELKKLKETLGLGSTGDLLTMDYSQKRVIST